MSDINTEIEGLLGAYISPVKMAVLFNGNEMGKFQCLHSTTPMYKEGEELLLYDIPPVLRVLCLKRKLFSEELEEELYAESMNSVSFVMEWSDHARKVIVFDLRELNYFETEGLLEQIDGQSENFQNIFQKIFYRGQQT